MYLDPTDDTARALLGRGISGPFLMLSLLRFHDWADYSQAPKQAMLIRQASLQGSFAFASAPEYLAGVCHSSATVADSRMLPRSRQTCGS